MKTGLMCSAVVLCSVVAGCVEDASEGVSAQESALASDHDCVAQSTASAYRTNDPWGPLQCSGWASSLPINTSLSQGHPVKFITYCGNPTYVNVLSLWTGSYYMMRFDALTPC